MVGQHDGGHLVHGVASVVQRAEHGELVAGAGDGLAQQVLDAVPLRAGLRDDGHAAGDHVAGVDGQVLAGGDVGKRQVRAVVGKHVNLAAEQGLERVVGAGEHADLNVDALFGQVALRVGDSVEDVAVVGGAQTHRGGFLGGRGSAGGVVGLGGGVVVRRAAGKRQAGGGNGGQADEAAAGKAVDHADVPFLAGFSVYRRGCAWAIGKGWFAP